MYGYMAQPGALKFYGPAGAAAFVMRLLPRPDLVANLAAKPDVIRQRKRELSEANIKDELDAWATLPVTGLRTFDATRHPDQVASMILREIGP